MAEADPKRIRLLSQRLHVDEEMLVICLERSFIEVEERGADLEIIGGTALQLRRVQRLAEILEIEIAIAAILLEKTDQIASLQHEIKRLEALLQNNNL